MAFKLKVVACTEGESNRGAARQFGVDEKRVREWRKLKTELAERGPKKKQLYTERGPKKKQLYTGRREEDCSGV